MTKKRLLKLKRKAVELKLEVISDTHCHLFPSASSPYPIDCGEVGTCLMEWVSWQQRLPGFPVGWESPKPHWEFTWWDKPLNYAALLEESK